MSRFEDWWEQFSAEHEDWRYADSDALRKWAFEAGAASRDAEVARLEQTIAFQKAAWTTDYEERNQLRKQVAILRSHMTTFVRRCEAGEIRSKKTYAAFVEALAATELKP